MHIIFNSKSPSKVRACTDSCRNFWTTNQKTPFRFEHVALARAQLDSVFIQALWKVKGHTQTREVIKQGLDWILDWFCWLQMQSKFA